MKYAKVFQWLSVVLVIAVMITAIGCGKKEGEMPTVYNSRSKYGPWALGDLLYRFLCEAKASQGKV